MKKILPVLALLLFALSAVSVHAYISEPIEEWSFNEGAGETVTGTVRSITGTLKNVIWEQDGLRFDYGNSSYVSFGRKISEALYRTDAAVISADIKPEYKSSFVRYRIATLYIDNTVGTEIYILPGRRLVIGCRSCKTDAWQSKQFLLPDCEESFNITAEISYRNKTVRAYACGTELPPVAGGSSVVFASDEYMCGLGGNGDFLGGNGSVNNSFNGIISKLKVFRGILPEAEYKKAGGKYADDIYKEITSGKYLFMKRNSQEINSHGGKLYTGNFRICPKYFENDLYFPAKTVFESFGWTYKPGLIGKAELENESMAFPIGESFVIYNNNKTETGLPLRLEEGECFIPQSVLNIIGLNVIRVNDYFIVCDTFKDISSEEYDYLNYRLNLLFNMSRISEPRNNICKTRMLIAESNPKTGQYIGSPSVLKSSGGALYAAHDLFGSAADGYKEYIYRSEDNGETWENISVVNEMYWSSLFENKDDLYLIGVSKPGGDIVVRKSGDGGYTWTAAENEKTGIIAFGNDKVNGWYSTGSTDVLCVGGRIYKAFEDGSDKESNYRHREAFVISADVGSDLLDSRSWTVSNKLAMDTSLLPPDRCFNDPIWLEGNIVEGRDGAVYNILRLDSTPTADIAAVLKISEDGKNIAFDRYIEFPGGMSLSNIKYDSNTGLYISLVNNVTDMSRPWQRNVLSVSFSENMYDWKLGETLVCDNQSPDSWNKSVQTKGYQYADWFTDDENIKFIVRESCNSGNFHNADCLTLYTAAEYKKYVKPSCDIEWYDTYKHVSSPGGRLSVKLNCRNLGNDKTAYAAVYSESGRLKSVAVREIAGEECFISVETAVNDTVKVFIWNDELVPAAFGILNIEGRNAGNVPAL
ncbi:MAG: exo-alpha-sialidase [Clostridia bacterium]|nr:exo-alpha-sialidase [Clostridia bacterium]